ncbi:MAG: GAF domain-containing protein, partial [Mycobacteriales bacterium]
ESHVRPVRQFTAAVAMTAAEDLLAELADVARELGPVVRPAGTTTSLQTVTDLARNLLSAAACSLAVLSDDESELEYVAASGAGAEHIVGRRIPADAGLAGWAVQSGQPIAVADLAQEARFDRAAAASTGYIPSAMVVVPVATERRTFGVLSLLDRDATRPDAMHDMTLLSQLGVHAAVLLEARAVFHDVGSTLLAALADAATTGGGLADALGRAGTSPRAAQARLAGLGAALAELSRRGPAERDLALGILTQVADFSRRSSRAR